MFFRMDNMLEVLFKDFMALLVTICNHRNSKKCKRLFAAYQMGLFQQIDIDNMEVTCHYFFYLLYPAVPHSGGRVLWYPVGCLICLSVFIFITTITCKYEWIFTKLGICNDIVEIRFGIANG